MPEIPGLPIIKRGSRTIIIGTSGKGKSTRALDALPAVVPGEKK